MKRVVLGLLLALLVVGSIGALAWRAYRSLDTPLNVAEPLRFKVVVGARLSQVTQDLKTRGVLPQPQVLNLYARWRGTASAIKAGEYEIGPGTSPRALLEKLVSGQVLLHSFTIVDGLRVQDILTALHHNPDIVTTLPDKAQAAMDKLGLPDIGYEGQFLPETYRFPSGTTDATILHQAHLALMRELAAAWTSRDPAIPLKNPQELLIMASIVEKESGLPQELPKIAGLYLHRLSIGMRLQADPTVIYGIGERYDGDIRTVDLRTDGPYNTYTRAGLPPTPIALPSAATLHATARPERTDALYFVASPKGDGSHVFSATLEQHNAAVAQYLTKLKQRNAAAVQ